MVIYTKGATIPHTPTDDTDLYPDTDGKLMAVSDRHRYWLTRILQTLEIHFAEVWLQTPAEQETARADQEVIARYEATARAEQAEAAFAQLREQLARLQSRDSR